MIFRDGAIEFEERYDGLPFTAEQVDGIGEFLGLPSHEASRKAAYAISGALIVYAMIDTAKRMVPDIAKEKRRLNSVARAARKLSQLICSGPSPMLLHDTPDRFLQGGDMDGLRSTAELSEMAVHRTAEFLVRCDTLIKNAEYLAGNDAALRRATLLPPARDVGKGTARISLWLTLFSLWEDAGKRVTETEEGPLYDFIAYVHACLGLLSPKPGTVGDAAEAWIRGEHRIFKGSPPPWEISCLNDETVS